MDWEEFLQEIERGEGQTVEFKRSLSQCDRGLEALCGMINADLAQGVIWFGVQDDGQPVGIEEGNLDSAQQKLSQKMRKFTPPIQPIIQVVDCEGRECIRVSGTRSRDTPYHMYDGSAFIREGSTTRKLTASELLKLSRRTSRDQHGGPWKCDNCGAVVGMLLGLRIGDHGIVSRTYECDCGGEYWPIS